MYSSKQNFYKPVRETKESILKLLRDKILFKHYLKKNIPVFIYQMGKVASKSVYKSLCDQYSGIVLHAHYFNANHTDWRVKRLFSWAINEAMPIDVISLTREPIGRNVSAFFQNFEKITAVPFDKANFSMQELKSIFLTKYKHEKPLRWFDKNIKENFGIDVYGNSFPKCGYAAYSHNNIRLLVMRSELSDNEKTEVLRDFLKLSEFHLVNRNIGEEKEYGLSYKNFKINAKLPFDYIDKMCKSKYFQHFYEKEYIDVIRKKWGEC
jgi:hypothetical protein